MTQKHLFANAIGEVFKGAFDYPIRDVDTDLALIEAKCDLATDQVNRSTRIDLLTVLPTYLTPILAFLVYLYKSHFNEKGKFRIKFTQWPSLIKQIGILVISLISISKKIV